MHRSLHRVPSCCGKIALGRARAASMASASTGRKRSAADDDHLLRFGRKSYSSKRAIAADLQRVRTLGLPVASSRASQYRARERKVGADTSSPYGEIVGQGELLCTKQKRGGAPYAVQHPDGMLYIMVRESPWFAATMRRALNQFPCTKESPWRLIIYHDGSSQTRSRVDISVVHVRYVCVTACVRGYTHHICTRSRVYIYCPHGYIFILSLSSYVVSIRACDICHTWGTPQLMQQACTSACSFRSRF